MSEIERIEPQPAHQHSRESDALLICAYEDEDKCRDMALSGSIPLARLSGRERELDKGTELIFYCN